ncbi:hypothetical protein H4R18_003084 [Coemansia javaensis]|uniref:DUF202 domain-containing protein n=1 Tax=Coemansia javaensis TaxID=2761396 RepID=A0A9W8HFS1_9FUNG|nr:hypothetical protein H4R18_003084 [Coemansia javaensis]
MACPETIPCSETTPLLPLLRAPRPRHSRASSATTCSQATGRSHASQAPWAWRVPGAIDNLGSTARDMFAAERNFLSWLRLALAAMGTGAAAVADIAAPPGRSAEPLGLLLFSVAAFAALAALSVFYHVTAQLAVDRRPLRWSAALLPAAASATAAAALLAALSAALRSR